MHNSFETDSASAWRSTRLRANGGEERGGEVSTQVYVRTTRDAGSTDWTEGARRSVQWGVDGVIIRRHSGHGPVYVVQHRDGTEAPYEAGELELV